MHPNRFGKFRDNDLIPRPHLDDGRSRNTLLKIGERFEMGYGELGSLERRGQRMGEGARLLEQKIS